MTTRALVGSTAAVLTAAIMAACGGSSPTAPSGGSGGGSGSGSVGATITITGAGVSPNSVTISVGQSVTLVNNDSKTHEIDSNPHPSHTDCPSLNLGAVAAGQSKTSNAFTSASTCAYHDHLDPRNAAWQGQVTVR